jgi:hypothetical protein
MVGLNKRELFAQGCYRFSQLPELVLDPASPQYYVSNVDCSHHLAATEPYSWFHRKRIMVSSKKLHKFWTKYMFEYYYGAATFEYKYKFFIIILSLVI